METESTYRQPLYYIVYSPIFSLRWQDIDAALRRLSDGYSPYYKAKSTNAQGCWIANKMHNGHGYVKLKVAGGGRREFYAHHLALIHSGAWSDVFWVHCKDAGDYEISHLCHNTRAASTTNTSWLNPRPKTLPETPAKASLGFSVRVPAGIDLTHANTSSHASCLHRFLNHRPLPFSL